MVMVYDLGGGTFDVSIIEIGDNVIEVLSTAGNNHLGGDDFDARLANYLADAFKAKTGVDLERDQMASGSASARRPNRGEKELSSAESTVINLPFLAQGPQGPLHLEETITRSTFDRITRDLVEATGGPVTRGARRRRALRRASWEACFSSADPRASPPCKTTCRA